MKVYLLLSKQIAVRCFLILIILLMLLTACLPQDTGTGQPAAGETLISTPEEIMATPLPTRQTYEPGTLVDYVVQTGDSLPALAAHFNTTIKEIREANPSIPSNVTTLPTGMPMQIPIYYQALWGNPYQILPDSLYVNGPASTSFNTVEFVNSQPGWLKNYTAFAGNLTRQGGAVVEYVAQEYSINPRVLLAIAEYQIGALSQPTLDPALEEYPLGYEDRNHKGFYLQLVWAANELNNAYYEWRVGSFGTITRLDGTLENPDPWQNAATVAFHYYFSLKLPIDQYNRAIYDNGLAATYRSLFGDPWQDMQPHLPGSLTQPTFILPFSVGKTWAFTGAPHAGWGEGDPRAALDFAPPVSGCSPSSDYALAIADGEVVRTEEDSGMVMLDLDMDGNENTGWDILYLHLTNKIVRQGQLVKAGDPLGHPSCLGEATGTHVHIARKYNGEWMPADSVVPFVMDGWTPHNGTNPYEGYLTKNGLEVDASSTSSPKSFINAGN
jgi:murein DD-endopeptidase MepM/ murein hydrolase activator NlpD